jgi:hypothetical protein
MVLGIVFIACATGVIKSYLKSREQSPRMPADITEKLERLERLEERVRVLEAIVTDRDYDLKRELHDL